MIKREDILFIPYLEKTEYTGSHEGMRYRMEKVVRTIEVKEGDETKEVNEKSLLVTVWPEPFNFFNTPDEKKISQEFSFDEDGIVDSIAWMNDRLFYDKALWDGSAGNWNQYAEIFNQ